MAKAEAARIGGALGTALLAIILQRTIAAGLPASTGASRRSPRCRNNSWRPQRQRSPAPSTPASGSAIRLIAAALSSSAADVQRWHLHPQGRLVPAPPPSEGADRYRYDPADSTPAVVGGLGGAAWPRGPRRRGRRRRARAVGQPIPERWRQTVNLNLTSVVNAHCGRGQPLRSPARAAGSPAARR